MQNVFYVFFHKTHFNVFFIFSTFCFRATKSMLFEYNTLSTYAKFISVFGIFKVFFALTKLEYKVLVERWSHCNLRYRFSNGFHL